MIERTFFDEPIDRRDTRCLKWDRHEVCPEGTIPLWVADMDFRSPPAVVEAVKKRAAHPVYGYTFASEAASEAFCAFWKRRHRVDIRPKEMLMIPCVVSGLKTCVRVFTDPGDEVCVMDPVYGPFFSSVRLNGRRVRSCPMRRDESSRYHIDFEALEHALEDGVKLILFCNPHNPASRLWSREELSLLVEAAARKGAVLVSDEIHADFVYAPGRFESMLRIPGAEKCVVAMMSASKTFNIAGLQQAEMVTRREDLLALCQKDMEESGVYSGNIFAMTAAEAAYREGDEWLDALLAYLDDNRKIVARELTERLPKAALTPVEATYLAWADLRAYAPTQEVLAEKLRQGKTALTMGAFFGDAYEGFGRINFGCPAAQLKEGLDRIVKVLAD